MMIPKCIAELMGVIADANSEWLALMCGVDAVMLAMLHKPTEAMLLAMIGLIASVVFHRRDRRYLEFVKRQRKECLEGWERTLAIAQSSTADRDAMMWCYICVLSNALDLTPIQNRDVVRGAMKLYQERRMVN